MYKRQAASFGEALSPKIKQSKVENLEKLKSDEVVQLEGTVKKLCEKKGCWMVLSSGNKDVRVTFKGYSFFLPAKLKGKTVKVQGTVKKKTLSVVHQKHLLEDEGAPSSEIAKITKEKVEMQFVANGVQTF